MSNESEFRSLKGPITMIAAVGGVGLLILTSALIFFDVFEAFYAYSRDHENWQLDELVLAGIAALLTISLCCVWLAWILIRRLKAQVADTEIARLEAELHSERAVRAEAARTRFLANMSHELRTPLTAISGFSDLLMEDLPWNAADPRLVGYARHINDACGTLAALVEDVLTLTDMETRGRTIMVEAVHPLQCLERVAGELAPMLAPRSCVVVIPPPATPVGPIATNQNYLVRILRNLLSELALECSSSEIVCRAEAAGAGEARLSLLARGLVWSDERVLELESMHGYGTGEARRPRQGPGTGLAVSLARGFLAALEGRLEVVRDGGNGCGFRVLLSSAHEPTA
ncbi:MAG: HAMP domain-containing histidine kinase [Rhodospirillum sp.]|nr:HAMP domain-containing histidine kinase [Rhodospirillum sp.]MCF8502610.1 HAMP domain-containing histidine kinase [Rhodospirillum sp.]